MVPIRPAQDSGRGFLTSCPGRLRPGGRLAAILPYSVLANPRHAELRDWLSARFVREAVVSLPEGVFKPFGGTASRACVVVLTKRPAHLRVIRPDDELLN